MVKNIEIGEYVVVPEKLKVLIQASDEKSYENFLRSKLNICGVEIKDGKVYLNLDYCADLVERFWRDDDLVLKFSGIYLFMTLYTMEKCPSYLGTKYYHELNLMLDEISDTGEYIRVRLIK